MNLGIIFFDQTIETFKKEIWYSLKITLKYLRRFNSEVKKILKSSYKNLCNVQIE